MYRTIPALALALCACSSDVEVPSDPEDYEVETPPRHAYDDTRPPFAVLPDDPAEQDAAPLPLAQMGEDDRGEGIVYSAALAGYYLMRIQVDADEGIGYHYQYDPVTGAYEESDNVHRKSGATFTQVWLYRFTQRPEFRVSTKRALEYLLSEASEQDDGSLRLRDVGATSLITLSLTEYGRLTGSDEFDDEIDALGTHLLGKILEDGSFSEGKPLQWAQAHQSLWRLYKYTGEVAYVEALEKVARYFYDHREDPEVIDFPYLYGLWANEPLTDLYMERPQDWIAQFVLEVGDDVAGRQYTPVFDVDEAWHGGWFPGSNAGGEPGWNSTLKLEAVIDAYRMAEVLDDAEHMERFRKSSLIGVQFLQRLQHRAGETDGFADPDFVVGGTPFSGSDPIVRLDVPHHMANAILKVVEYMDLEDHPGR
jgi:hypothetical protein